MDYASTGRLAAASAVVPLLVLLATNCATARRRLQAAEAPAIEVRQAPEHLRKVAVRLFVRQFPRSDNIHVQHCTPNARPICENIGPPDQTRRVCTPPCQQLHDAVARAFRKAGVRVVTDPDERFDLRVAVDVSIGLTDGEAERAARARVPISYAPNWGSPLLEIRTSVAGYGIVDEEEGSSAYARFKKAASSKADFQFSQRIGGRIEQCKTAESLQPPDRPSLDNAAAEMVNTLWACADIEKLAKLYDEAGVLVASAPAAPGAAPIASTPGPASAPVRTVAASAAPTSPVSPSPVLNLVAATPQPASYALIIGVERYRDVPAATGARADAERFAQVARQTLGLTSDRIRLALEDRATRSDMVSGLDWLAENVPAGGRIYFFFSGHGAPAADQATYLLPYDGNPKSVGTSALSMNEVMTRLGTTRAKEVVAFIDSCFSGAGGRSVLPPGARPLMRVKEALPASHMGLFTASQGDEISGTASGENLGAFTKYLTQGMGTGQADINGDGQISLQELSEWVSPRVAREARQDNREQHPKLIVGSGLGVAANLIVAYGLAHK